MPGDTQLILQFGTGRFLRAFIGMFVHEINEKGDQSFGRCAMHTT